MSYQVLARKWRPHNFKQVVGQQHVLTALVNALDQNRLHHAYLFSGTRGVGKTSIARILAKSLNCEKGVTSEPCGVCHHCQDIDQGRFVDLLEIDAASRTKVEDTRELLDNVQYKPAQGRYKVYLIDEVHMLSKSSFNALLKTLEEPPEYVKFLLATTDPQKLPITILSRCLQFHLKSLSSDDINQQLGYILGQEQHSYEPAALQALAKAAHGSMRDALSLADQAIAFGNGVVNYQPVLAMLGTLDHHQVTQLLHFVAAGDAQNTLDKVSELVTLGPDFDLVHNEIAATLHQVALAHMLPSTLNGLDNSESIQLLSEQLSPEQVQLYYQIALKGKQDLPLAPEPRVGLEMTLMRMLAFHPAKVATSLPSAPVSSAVNVTNPVSLAEPSVNAPAQTSPAKLTESATSAPTQAVQVTPPAPQVELTAEVSSGVRPEVEPVETAQPPHVSHNDDFTSHLDKDIHGQPNAEPPSQSAHYAPPNEEIAQQSEMASQSPAQIAQQVASVQPAMPSVSNALETRNMLRSRKLALEAGKKQPVVKKVTAPAKPSVEPQPLAAAPVSQSHVSQTPVSQSSAPSNDIPEGFNELPPLEAYDNDYAQYFQTDEYDPSLSTPQHLNTNDGFDASPASEPASQQSSYQQVTQQQAPVTPVASRPSSQIAPLADVPWDTGEAQSVESAPVEAPTPAISARTEAEYTRAMPDMASKFSPQNNDPWCQLIEQMGLVGILRQLAINSVCIQTPNAVQLMLQPSSQHLDNARNLGQITAALQSVLPNVEQVEIVIGQHQTMQTPVEIEQAIYLARLAQAKVDIQQDEAINFFIQRFGASVDEESIKPL
ncbi:DNA polymerase III subunit gamma/tau [Motilimonas cestriensis]|uniref:DNA-directed DNA polymerase n=1 Tax=Motilimonas cestriensis TaxID=2742685 RepID=A0ABS8W9M2_9GAMM|nr:DNA polymerase III subunit gamma/tau [Motilimonas cestriensis]MCE2595709.1 DNA polymerase III subunit gamma/tau [Motilimonas cestriensis]